MIKRVEINLGQGNLTSGFPHVKIELKVDGASKLSLISSLEPAKQVIDCYYQWKKIYQNFYQESSNCAANSSIEVVQPSTYKASNVNSQYRKLRDAINNWLHTRDFCMKEKQLRTALGEEDEFRVIISTEDELTLHLPWDSWIFFEHYINAGLVMSRSEFKSVNSRTNNFNHEKQKLLVIVDDAKNKSDLKIWAQKKEKYIEMDILSGEEISDTPQRKIHDKLYKQSWNIIFFAGHSSSHTEDGEARLYIDSNHCLTISQLENALKYASSEGLKLAILNSCDGLGFVKKLFECNIQKVIVMREDVPNKVAEKFLEYFLEEFMANKGIPAFLAVRRAREKLQGWENEFPSASFLPVMFSNPATEPLVIHPKSKWLFSRVKYWFANLKAYFYQGFLTFRHPIDT